MDNAIFHVGGSYGKTERWNFIGDPNSDSVASSDFERVTLSQDLDRINYPSLFIVKEDYCT